MARKPKAADLDGGVPGWHIFQEVSEVTVMPGLGIFTDPTQDLTPNADGKIPVHTRSSDSFETTRFRATKARIQYFIQENRQDLLDSGITPETMDFVSTVSAGFFTEKALREFMGDGDAEDQEESVYEVGKGWVKKKQSWGWGEGSSRSYGPIWSSGSSWEKPKAYRTLSAQLKDLTTQVTTEMQTGALRALENPADITRVVMLKVIEKIDVMKLEPAAEWEDSMIISSIMGDMRSDLGYSQAYESLLSSIRAELTGLVSMLSQGLRTYFKEAVSPERLMLDLGVLVDVTTKPHKDDLGQLMMGLGEVIEKAENAEAERLGRLDDDWDPKVLSFGAPHDPSTMLLYDDKVALWGRLKILEHPLIPDTSLRKRSVTYKATDVGSHLGILDRLLTDKRIFREMRATPTGSLLVDCSGSMGLSVENVYQVLNHVPGAVIGLYSGSRSVGVLHIIARSGKVAADLGSVITAAIRLGGNVVDGPSLEWLGSMPTPRIWYSDGVVTGKDDSVSLNLRPHANHLMHKGGIARIANQKQLPHAFRHMQREKTVGRL